MTSPVPIAPGPGALPTDKLRAVLEESRVAARLARIPFEHSWLTGDGGRAAAAARARLSGQPPGDADD